MATTRDKGLARARRLLADHPFEAWQAATTALQADGGAEAAALWGVAVDALGAITSDLDEHGEDNLHLYGGGRYSEDDFKALLSQARAEQEKLRRAGAPAPSALLQTAPAIELGTPMQIAAGGPSPLPVAGGAFVGSHGEVLVLRDLGGAIVRRFQSEVGKSIAVSPDRGALAVGTWGDKVGVFDVASGEPRWQVETQSGWVTAVAFSPDGTRLVSGGEGRLMLHDAGTGATVAVVEVPGVTFRAIAYTDGAAAIVTLGSNRLMKWSATDLAQLASHGGELGTSLAIVGSTVGGGGAAVVIPYNLLAIRDPATGDEIASAKLFDGKHHRATGIGLGVSPRGDLAAILFQSSPSPSKKKLSLLVWSLSPLAQLGEVPLSSGHDSSTQSVGGVAFTPDAEAIIVSGAKRTAVIPIRQSAQVPADDGQPVRRGRGEASSARGRRRRS